MTTRALSSSVSGWPRSSRSLSGDWTPGRGDWPVLGKGGGSFKNSTLATLPKEPNNSLKSAGVVPAGRSPAMMIAAFQQYGMQPGPLLFERSGDLVWPLLASFFLGLTILLIINLLLLVVGALMDIYSAIIVVVPLITPIGAAYGIHPVHLGIIFLANMELGYLMPPMGENLFLSAFRFDKPLIEVYRATLPYMLILLAAVLVITYWPAFTLGPASLVGP